MQRSHKIVLAIAGVIFLALCCVGASRIYQLQFWRGPDEQFGDQHLKTTVALVELHKVRYGHYPETLSDLRFTGAWDSIAIGSVSYRTNADRSRYCLKVERGWVGKPRLEIPPEFWQGTGYDRALCK